MVIRGRKLELFLASPDLGRRHFDRVLRVSDVGGEAVEWLVVERSLNNAELALEQRLAHCSGELGGSVQNPGRGHILYFGECEQVGNGRIVDRAVAENWAGVERLPVVERKLRVEARAQRTACDRRLPQMDVLRRSRCIRVERIDPAILDKKRLRREMSSEVRMVQFPGDSPVEDRAAALEFDGERVSVLS